MQQGLRHVDWLNSVRQAFSPWNNRYGYTGDSDWYYTFTAALSNISGAAFHQPPAAALAARDNRLASYPSLSAVPPERYCR